MNILESVKNISHCDLTHDKIKCKGCNEEMSSPKKRHSLQDHLMMIFGFALYHEKCIIPYSHECKPMEYEESGIIHFKCSTFTQI